MSEKDLTPLKKTSVGKYIPIEDLIQASVNNPNLNNSDIAKMFNVTPSAIHQRFSHAGYTPQRLKHYKDNRANIFDFLASKIINSLTPRDLKRASFLQKITAMGILYDKMRIERGLSTVNVNIQALHAEAKDLDAEDRRLQAEIDKLEGKATEIDTIDVKPVDNSVETVDNSET